MTPVKCAKCGEQIEVAFYVCHKCGGKMAPLQDNFAAKEFSYCDRCLHQQKRTQPKTGKCYYCMFSPENH